MNYIAILYLHFGFKKKMATLQGKTCITSTYEKKKIQTWQNAAWQIRIQTHLPVPARKADFELCYWDSKLF